MAVVTARLLVCAVEFETSRRVVVEKPVVPRIRVVADFAVGAQSCLVDIVAAVAVVTLGRSFAVRCAQMAFLASYRRVHANQWKTTEVVVEQHAVTPAFFIVAIVAFPALPAFVYIVLAVACVT